MTPESVALYLAVACTALGQPSTERWILNRKPSHANPIYQEVEEKLEERASKLTEARLMSLLEGVFDLERKREQIIAAGMSDVGLRYITQDVSTIIRHLLSIEPLPADTVQHRYRALTHAVCTEAKERIAHANRQGTFERAAKVIFGASARIAAAKLTGGVSEVLNAIGEIAIDRGLGD
jgi:hypothetical protein